jgi:hypothetical protein
MIKLQTTTGKLADRNAGRARWPEADASSAIEATYAAHSSIPKVQHSAAGKEQVDHVSHSARLARFPLCANAVDGPRDDEQHFVEPKFRCRNLWRNRQHRVPNVAL